MALCADCVWWCLGVCIYLDDVFRTYERKLGHCSDHIFSLHRCWRKWKSSTPFSWFPMSYYVKYWILLNSLQESSPWRTIWTPTLQWKPWQLDAWRSLAFGTALVQSSWTKSLGNPAFSLHFARVESMYFLACMRSFLTSFSCSYLAWLWVGTLSPCINTYYVYWFFAFGVNIQGSMSVLNFKMSSAWSNSCSFQY